jgi:peroxiredoxin
MATFNITAPIVTFKCRVEDDDQGYVWKEVSTFDLFRGRRVIVFAIPGAFTPTCSSTHLPGYESEYRTLKEKYGIDEVFCLSVNDSFVMNAWFKSMGIRNVKPLPDGSGEFTRKMGFLVNKDNLGFGMRSWRYSMILVDGVVDMMWVEPGLEDLAPNDPFVVSDVNTLMKYLESTKVV